MKQITRLEALDIKEIIREYFMKKNDTVVIPSVKLYTYQDTEGYGMSEHEVTKIRAEVEF